MLISKKTLAGGVWFSALLLAVTSLIATTTITTPIASAADEQPTPACTNPKDSTLPADFPADYIPGGYDGGPHRLHWQTCDDGILQANTTYGSYTYTLTATQKDDGWRIWYTSFPYGKPSGTNTQLGYMGSIATQTTPAGGIIFASDDAYYATAPILNAKLSVNNNTVMLTSSGASMILQVTKITARTSSTTIPTDEALPVLHGNGGTWAGETIRTPKIKTGELLAWTTGNLPTQEGYTFKQWSTDPTGSYPIDANTKVYAGTVLYAQWEKNTGDPQTVDLDCSTGGRCELTVNYSNSPARTREFQPGASELTWTSTPIPGVRLDASGYKADGACSDTRCWYVSLDKEPSQQGSYQAQMPTTGAPEGLTVVGLLAVSIGLLSLVIVRRSRV